MVISVNWAILTVSRKIATVVPTILAILTVLKQDWYVQNQRY